MEITQWKLSSVESKDMSEIISMLRKHKLCYTDIGSSEIILRKVSYENNLAGLYGLEVHDIFGLLRSLVVKDRFKGIGMGSFLVQSALKEAKEKNIDSVYLLTTSAKTFFEKFGFRQIPRENAPKQISGTAEFKDFCPDSAAFMIKKLK